jgi:hypothetical protein
MGRRKNNTTHPLAPGEPPVENSSLHLVADKAIDANAKKTP